MSALSVQKESTERLIDMVEECAENYNDALLGQIAEELHRRLVDNEENR